MHQSLMLLLWGPASLEHGGRSSKSKATNGKIWGLSEIAPELLAFNATAVSLECLLIRSALMTLNLQVHFVLTSEEGLNEQGIGGTDFGHFWRNQVAILDNLAAHTPKVFDALFDYYRSKLFKAHDVSETKRRERNHRDNKFIERIQARQADEKRTDARAARAARASSPSEPARAPSPSEPARASSPNPIQDPVRVASPSLAPMLSSDNDTRMFSPIRTPSPPLHFPSASSSPASALAQSLGLHTTDDDPAAPQDVRKTDSRDGEEQRPLTPLTEPDEDEDELAHDAALLAQAEATVAALKARRKGPTKVNESLPVLKKLKQKKRAIDADSSRETRAQRRRITKGPK